MKFMVTYQMPHEGLDDWMKLPEDERQAQEVAMQAQWNDWLSHHKNVVLETAGVGKPKRITALGVKDTRNDIMMFSFIEAASLDEAAEIFVGHPHFGIPGGWIEVMAVNKNIS
jgi:hypothetical protein